MRRLHHTAYALQLAEYRDILAPMACRACREASTTNVLEGPRLYYSLFGARGLLLGAKARLLCRPIEVSVAVPGIPHPVHLRLRTTDVPLCREILLNAQYDWDVPRSPRVIVDAGANIGLAAIFFANKYPESRIFAIEPESSNYEMLKQNAAPYPNIVSIHAALWKENQDLDILDPGTGHTTFRTKGSNESASTGARLHTRGVTLNKLMEDLRIGYIDLLKVDIEGSEKVVFEHSSPWIGNVGVIAVEIHDWIQTGCSDSVHLATKDFELKWQKGETSYFGRKDDALKDEASTRGMAGHSSTAHRIVTSKFPLRILETA